MAAVIGALAFITTFDTTARAAEMPIQPGAELSNGCTMNFVFADARDTYIGTAGHCTSRVGQRMGTRETGLFGTVAFREFDERGARTDFALIRIDAAKRGVVSPVMRQWGGPTGYSTEGLAPGTELAQFGWGMVYGDLGPTRARRGVLTAQAHDEFYAQLPALWGDSGSPVIETDSGRAVGVVTALSSQAARHGGITEGPTIEYVLELLHDAGFAVRLVTAAK